MHVEKIRDYCLSKNKVEEGLPFGEDTLVFKVGGKIFLLLSLESTPLQFNVKCAPDLAIQLREQYSCVLPGYHMNKQHWNTILCDGRAPERLILGWIDHSYDLVRNSLPKKMRD
jgi:predicted DNA-binding protein (MmcQ/YjbR family)